MKILRGWLWRRRLIDMVGKGVGICRYESERFDCGRSLECLGIDRSFMVVQVMLWLVSTTT